MTLTTTTAPQNTAPGSGQLQKGMGEAPAPVFKLAISQRERALLVVLALIVSTLLPYRPTLHSFFQTYDDPLYVVENAHVNTGLTWANVRWAFTAVYADNWHPLTWVSHMVDVQLFGLKPLGHHLDSMLWHALNVVLLFLLLRAATGFLWRSATVAALFALCPLNVECVAWVAERKSLICTTFLLLTLFAYGGYVRRRSVSRYLLVLAPFALGLMAKPMIVTLPALLLLIDYWPLQRFDLAGPFDRALLKRWGLLFVEKIPLFVLSAASSAVTIYAQKHGGTLVRMVARPTGYRIENAIRSYGIYVLKMFWPSGLSIYYPHPATLNLAAVIATAVALVASTALVWRYRRIAPLTVGWAWFLITLTPVIGVIQMGDQAWADRYAYIPYMGLFVAAVWIVADLVPRMNWDRSIPVVAAILALSGYASAASVQVDYWRDSYTLFSHAFHVTSRNGTAELQVGVILLEAGQPARAESHLRAAVDYMPDFPTAYYDLGLALQEEGRTDEALREYKLMLAHGESALAHNNIAVILLGRGDLPAALAEYRLALRLDPNDVHSLIGRGTAEYRLGQFQAALADLTKSAQLSPTPEACSLIGRVYARRGDLKTAEEWDARAQALGANNHKLSPGLVVPTPKGLP